MHLATHLYCLLITGTTTGSYFVLGQCPAGGQTLSNSYQCISNKQCQNIAPGYYCYQGICCSDSSVNSVPYGGYCTTTTQCSTPGAICFAYTCQCAQGSQYNGRSCIAATNYCPINHMLINGQCQRKVSYGFMCNYTQQCIYTGAVCADGLCRCQLGYTFDGNKCIPRSMVCPGNRISIGGNCYPFARLGEACVYSEQCIDKWIRSLRCIQGICTIPMDDDVAKLKCSDPRAEVEYANGTVKNCLYIPCTVGYFCEFSESQNGGQYICCGTNANNIYGKVKFYPGTSKPMECTVTYGCPYVDTPNCVMSYRYGYKVCCSTTNC